MSKNRFVSELTKTAIGFEKALKGKTATDLRTAARKVNTVKQFEEFKRLYSKDDFLIAYAIKVAETIDRTVKINDIEKKMDLFSEIISKPEIGLNKAYESFNPDKQICTTCGEEIVDTTDDTVANWYEEAGKKFHTEDNGEFFAEKLVCGTCKKSSTEIIDAGAYYEKDGKRFHTDDDGELVCKCFNSWVIDHLRYATKNIDKDADKRSQFREYACPHCGRFVLEGTSNEEEELNCKACSAEQNAPVNFLKRDARRSKKSFYNTEINSLSQPIGNGEDENLTLTNILVDKDDSEELMLKSRLKDVIAKIKGKIGSWKPMKTGIFKNPADEAEMFDYFIPSEFLYSEADIAEMNDQEFEKKIKLPNKATGLIIAEKAGYTFPYVICLDCGLKVSLGKNWNSRIGQLQKQGCPHRHLADEHKTAWTDNGAYDRNRAIAEPLFQFRLGYKNERGLSSGSNEGKIVEFVAENTMVSEAKNYDERRIAGMNLELRSYNNGFSDIGDHAQKPLPIGYEGVKEHITLYMHQVANRWMGKLRQDCPSCHTKVEQLSLLIGSGSPGQGKVTCPHCSHVWVLREGDFIKRIKKDKGPNGANELYQQFLSVLRELLFLRKNSNTGIISIGKAGL